MRKSTLEEFVTKSRAVHGSRYNYDKAVYTGNHKHLTITCPTHGDFSQAPSQHLSGRGCPECGKEASCQARRKTLEEFVAEASLLHGGFYDYSQAYYQGVMKKLTVLCPEHGPFMTTPNQHLRGVGCPECGKCKVAAHARKKRVTLEQFITHCTKKHKGRYFYDVTDFSNYESQKSPVKILCLAHGIFEQSVDKHMQGQGCPQCGVKKSAEGRAHGAETFIVLASAVHKGKYAYPNVEYKNVGTKVQIFCPEHGEFWQTPHSHLDGQGCPECKKLTLSRLKSLDYPEFAQRAKETHGGRYTYPQELYTKMWDKIGIICPDHGLFYQVGGDHVAGRGCSKCVGAVSREEQEVVDFIKSLGFEVIQNNRTLLRPKEVDILVPAAALAIEYNGILWHNELFGKGQDYHKGKTDAAAKAGYDMIHIFDYQWRDRRQAVESLLMSRLGKREEAYDARKCKVVSPNTQQAKEFAEQYHIQGFRQASEYFGLEFEGRLVALATFGASKAKYPELQRYCTARGSSVRGGMGRLITAWRRKHPGEALTTFCDLTHFTGESYQKIGFRKEKELAPDYQYTNGNRVFSKERFRRSAQQEMFGSRFDPALTEKANAEANGWYKMWGVGRVKYVI